MKTVAAAGFTGAILGAALMFAGTPGTPGTPDVGKHGEARSSRWPAVRAQHLKQHPVCEVCRSTKDLEVHHVLPYHTNPDLELEPTNLITLCASPSCKSHLTIGHLGNYQRSNPHVREDAALLKKRRDESQ